MQLRFYSAFLLFLGSYFPLSIILLVQNYRMELWGNEICLPWRNGCEIPLQQPVVSIGFAVVCLFCLIFTLVVLRSIRPRMKVEIVEAKHVPADLMNYVLPYVVSFMGLSYDDVGKFLGFIVFILWIFVITFKSERIIMNPVLTVFKWKLYEVKYRSPGGSVETTGMALTQVAIDSGVQYKIHAIQDVLIVKGGGFK